MARFDAQGVRDTRQYTSPCQREHRTRVENAGAVPAALGLSRVTEDLAVGRGSSRDLVIMHSLAERQSLFQGQPAPLIKAIKWTIKVRFGTVLVFSCERYMYVLGQTPTITNSNRSDCASSQPFSGRGLYSIDRLSCRDQMYMFIMHGLRLQSEGFMQA
jgi:hypothetical protein